MVADVLDDAHYTGDADTVLLLVSELATNAVRHAATPWELHIACTRRTVTVEVLDHDATHKPEVQHPGPDATSGRGLLIVERLATRWGCEPRGDGKAVWFSCR